MQPSDWVIRFAPLLSPNTSVLDLACGAGRHGRVFLERGCQVQFVDKDIASVSDLDQLNTAILTEMDLEDGRSWPFEAGAFDAIVVTNYLYRAHLSDLLDSLKPQGVLIYETFARGNERFGRPKNPDFLLQEAELLTLVQGRLSVIAFEQGIVEEKVVQRLCAIKDSVPRRLYP
ncbi:MAG: class I SAM-dependent methyltransferase [Methylocystaceae bacterium]|nr:class I SAM-dependent methyltransferase [Methylocystaceae bacterium]